MLLPGELWAAAFLNVKSNHDSLVLSARTEATQSRAMSNVPADEEDYGVWRRAHPAIRNVAVVQCEGFRCLAYRDEEIWREFETGKELPEVKSVVSTFTI